MIIVKTIEIQGLITETDALVHAPQTEGEVAALHIKGSGGIILSRNHVRGRGLVQGERSNRTSERKKRRWSTSSSSRSSSSRERAGGHKGKGKHKRSRSRERRKEKKKDKKEKKEKKKAQKAGTSHWGKYGIITDIDIFSKGQEFHTWLVEERKVNPETISKDQQKKEFSRFVEDYNTATLPHEKYYNMEVYERRMSALRSGEYLPPTDDLYDFNADMKALSSSKKKKPAENETYMSRDQLMELRRVQQERSEVGKMKLLGMDIKQNFGVRMDGSMFDG
ncbi:hypothetical protein CVT24_004524 [Panaeolus cyanescens]|uniref:Uncharacterized protein n=1 Tax=Panaeolus cyanescens TaxID=181874 RepID=A0A409YBV2_9AGAR|nr:hypothetical protein CVT24_004524 [Panaeolus cyanescens]